MKNYREHLVHKNSIARDALKRLELLPEYSSKTLFVIGDKGDLLGTVTDGDIRRGLLRDLEISDSIEKYMNTTFRYLVEGEDNLLKIKELRSSDVGIVPVLDQNKNIASILDMKVAYSLLPVSALIMAGGRGERLRPFTDSVPKPMLPIGSKPIIEYNIDRLIRYGVKEIFISVEYLKEQIKEYFGDGSTKGISIKYIEETTPLGTIGALSLIESIQQEHLLVINSDVLTNIDYEDFFNVYIESNARMCVASIPYKVNIPYAVLQTEGRRINAFVEKPCYTYYSNGGIYFLDSELKQKIPTGRFYNVTDLMEKLISSGEQVSHYPLLNYWLDIGRHQDYLKAQEDIKHIPL